MKITFIFVLIYIHSVFGIFSFDADPDFLPCLPGEKFDYIDWSNVKLSFDPSEQKVYLNGFWTQLKEFGGEIAFNFTSEQFYRGKWTEGIFKFFTYDFCKYINNPMGQPIIYMAVQKALQQKRCPFKPGVRKTLLTDP